MKLISKSECFEFDNPIGEPDVKWNKNDKYKIERITDSNETIIWFGINTNWKKEKNENWKTLIVNHNSNITSKNKSDFIFAEFRSYWKECEIPIYEKMIQNEIN